MRRLKWHTPPPSPKILYLPRRHHWKHTRTTARRPKSGNDPRETSQTHKGKLSTLFNQEQRTMIPATTCSCTVPIVLLNSSGDCERRERVKEEEQQQIGESERGIVEEKWRFQAEILRAECNFLRAEREFALKKLKKKKVKLEKTLSAAVQILISGRKKIREGKSTGRVLEEEIEDLAKKLRTLQESTKVRYFEGRKCSNFDKQAFLLQKRLEKGTVSHEKCMKKIQKIAESSLSIHASSSVDERSFPNCKSDPHRTDVEILRRKMEQLSKGMLLGRMEKEEEELGSMLLSTTIISPAATSATLTPRTTIEYSDSSSSSTTHNLTQESSIGHEESTCEGQCKAVVRRVMEQVRAETEQWTQMQKMLGQVRQEMEELVTSRDFWEHQALHSNSQIHSLLSHLKEWRHKAVTSEAKANELQAQVSVLQGELEELRINQSTEVALKVDSQIEKEKEKEKRVLICQLKENHEAKQKKKEKEAFTEGRRKVQISSSLGGAVAPKWSPLGDISNVSPLVLSHYNR